MNASLLEVSDLKVVYKTYEGTVAAVNGLDFSLDRGKTLGLVGESGAGKTTTALSIMGLVPSPPGVVENGRIAFGGKNLLSLPEREMKKIRGNRISMIFQDPMTSLNPVVTVGVQIAEALVAHQNLSETAAQKRAMEMLEKVQIPGARFKEYPHEFSGGMRQRVVIAMALACNPALIIADEPTTALDVTIQAQVLELMRSLKDEFSTAMIMITHDLGVVGEVCDHVAVMYAGRIVETGSLEQIFAGAKHPYTTGLFRCIPDIEEETSVIRPIEGLMPEPLDLPKGCAFHPRCPQCMHVCRTTLPPVLEENGHKVMCHLYTPGGALDD
jgi:peptide/nickel transport system ATP-binding protein